MKKKVGLFLLLFAVTTEMAFAATYNVIYRVQYQHKSGSWVYTNTGNESKMVSGLTVTSENAAKNQVRKEVGAKSGQDTWVAKDPLYPKDRSKDTNFRIQWILVEKIEAPKKQETAPEPKKDWVERNFKPLNLK